MKQKYDHQICVRINDKLRDAINNICEDTNINTADYIRNRLASSATNDIENMTQVRQDFMFG